MSILKVDTINEKTTGNGVVIPSGQTLDVSAGTLVPSAGQVVQEAVKKITSGSTFSSNSYTDASGFALTITPKYASSKIIITYWAKSVLNNSTENAGHDYRILRDSTEIASARWQSYLNRNQYTGDFYPLFDGIFIDEPNTTSAVLYKLQGRKYDGQDYGWSINANGGTDNYFFSVKELKQ